MRRRRKKRLGERILDFFLGTGESPTDTPGVYVRNWDGRFFIKPEEYLRNPEVRRQMKQLEERFGKEARTVERGKADKVWVVEAWQAPPEGGIEGIFASEEAAIGYVKEHGEDMGRFYRGDSGDYSIDEHEVN